MVQPFEQHGFSSVGLGCFWEGFDGHVFGDLALEGAAEIDDFRMGKFDIADGLIEAGDEGLIHGSDGLGGARQEGGAEDDLAAIFELEFEVALDGADEAGVLLEDGVFGGGGGHGFDG